MSTPLATLVLLAALAAAPSALAHKSSDAYLQLSSSPEGVALRVDVALRDLDVALDLDADGDGRLTWGEVKAAWPVIESYVMRGVEIDGCSLRRAGRGLERRSDGTYAVVELESSCRLASDPVIRYGLMRGIDATHRGIAKIALSGESPRVRVLDPGQPLASGTTLADAQAAKAPAPGATAFLREGVLHILTGYDHVLFLLCLLLPAAMRRTPQGWQPVSGLKEAVLPVIGIVTAFTLAHSITLGLAASGRVSLPSSFIEPAIAVTIVLAALDNIFPLFRGRRAIVAFAFGLIHGFGFAGALAELDLPATAFAWALLQFNVGLELGQLMIVVVACSLLYLVRSSPRYPAWVIRGGSAAAILVGALWFVERTADISVLPL
jgi:HupE / UreJ protein